MREGVAGGRRWVAVALLAAATAAHADGFGLGLYLEPSLTRGTLETRDQLGRTTTSELSAVSQAYRLTFDRQFSPTILISAGGILQDRSSRTSTDGRVSSADETARNLYARLGLTLPVLVGGLTYDLGEARASGARLLYREEVAGYADWRPIGLPELSVRLTRSHSWDDTRLLQDATTTGALLSARYHEDVLDAKYTLLWARPSDAITGTESSSLDQVAQGTYAGRLFQDRTSLYASLTLRNQVVRTLSPGAGELVEQLHPVAGLSLLEVFPTQPQDAVLLPNPALVDGDKGASAAVDLGYGRSLAGDTARRDVGFQLADLLTPVDRLKVWVDRRVPPEVAAAFAWSAWKSDDNRTWTPVAIAGPVTFGAFENAFELPILSTQARFLKVVTQPLAAGVTTDPAFASLLVTELEAFRVTLAAEAASLQATSGAVFNGSATTLVWEAAHLSWDVSTMVSRRLTPTTTIWSFTNALNASQDLARGLQLGERLSRQDGDFGTGHAGQTEWSVGLTWKPVPTFTGTLTYGGHFVDARPVLDLGTGTYSSQVGDWTHTLSALARADLYEGISAQVNMGTGFQNAPDGTNTWSSNLNATTSLIPNPYVSATFGVLSSVAVVMPAFEPSQTTSSARLDASVTFRPTSAISASGTINRRLTGPIPATSGSGQLSYSPLRGDLQLTLAYTSTFDTASQTVIQSFTPGLRWNVRPGLLVTVNYSVLDSAAPVSHTRSKLLTAGFSLNL